DQPVPCEPRRDQHLDPEPERTAGTARAHPARPQERGRGEREIDPDATAVPAERAPQARRRLDAHHALPPHDAQVVEARAPSRPLDAMEQPAEWAEPADLDGGQRRADEAHPGAPGGGAWWRGLGAGAESWWGWKPGSNGSWAVQ